MATLDLQQDLAFHAKKRLKRTIYVIMLCLALLILSAVALSLGGLSVSYGAIVKGLFVAYDPQVALIYDLRFPRIVIALLAGQISQKTWVDVGVLLPYTLIGLGLALLFSRICDLLLLDDQVIRNLGMDSHLLRLGISLIAVLLASAATSVVGVVSFLGLIVPHISRLLVGSKHQVLIPFSALLGAFVFLLADTLGRRLAYPLEISPAIIMSIIGGPYFIYLLRRSDVI